jgi:integrase
MKGQHEETLSNGYKKRYLDTYEIFCEANQLPYDKPKIRYQPPIPLIPTSEDVNSIINSASQKYACILKIMSEIAVEGEELHRTRITQIDKEQGTISINGTKGHANGVYKLKPQTAEMLRTYLAKHLNQEYPFPAPKAIGQNYRKIRGRTATKLAKPSIKQIMLKNLRNYAGATFYKTTGNKDPIATMRFMRHKCLETTLHYIRAINLDEPEEYTTKTIQLGTPDTQKQIVELLDAGYIYITDADGYKYFRKRK